MIQTFFFLEISIFKTFCRRVLHPIIILPTFPSILGGGYKRFDLTAEASTRAGLKPQIRHVPEAECLSPSWHFTQSILTDVKSGDIPCNGSIPHIIWYAGGFFIAASKDNKNWHSELLNKQEG